MLEVVSISREVFTFFADIHANIGFNLLGCIIFYCGI